MHRGTGPARLLIALLVVLTAAALGSPTPAEAAGPTDEAYEPTALRFDALPQSWAYDRVSVRFDPPPPEKALQTLSESMSGGSASGAGIAQDSEWTTVEIEEFARGMGDDPLRIYEFVLNSIETVPSWGLMKPPRETLISRQGNPLGQAALLSALLRAAGYSTRYAFGTVEMSGEVAAQWVGVKNPSLALVVFENAGVPVEPSGDSVRIAHSWMEVQVENEWIALDPSFKPYESRPGMDLATMMEFDEAGLLEAARLGASVTADSATGINGAAVEQLLTDYGVSLLDEVRAVGPFDGVSEIAGGRAISKQTLTALPAELPYSTIGRGSTSDEVPEDLRYDVTIQLDGLNYSAHLDTLVGQRVSIFYDGAAASSASESSEDQQARGYVDGHRGRELLASPVRPILRVGGSREATGSSQERGALQAITVEIDTPILNSDGERIVLGFQQTLTAGASYAIPFRAQDVSTASLNEEVSALQAALNDGAPESDEAVLGQALYVLGLSYFNQTDLADRIVARVSNVVRIPLLSVALASENLDVDYRYEDGALKPIRVAQGTYGIDVQLNLNSLVSSVGDENAERGYSLFGGMLGSATEHAIIEQLQDTPSVSTIRVLNDASAEDQPIYHIVGQGSGGEDQTLALDYPPSLIDYLRTELDEGRQLIIPMADVAALDWIGAGFISFDPESGSAAYTLSQSLGGVGTVRGAVTPERIMSSSGAATANAEALVPARRFTAFDPVDVAQGAFLYRLGGIGPRQLTTLLSTDARYRSDAAIGDGTMGPGWTLDCDVHLFETSNWQRVYGEGSAADAVPVLVASYVGSHLLSQASYVGQLDRLLTANLTADWLTGHVTDNATVLRGGEGQAAEYLELADDSYAGRPANAGSLRRMPDQTYRLTRRDGVELAFDAHGRAHTMVADDGRRFALTYDSTGRLRKIAGSTGLSISFSYGPKGLVSASDSSGRSVQYGYNADGTMTSATGPTGEVTRFVYDTDYRIVSVTDPTGATYVTNSYNELSRVGEQSYGQDASIQFLYGPDRTVVVGPLGDTESYLFDDCERLRGIVDPVGGVVALEYDAGDNLVSWTDALGNATSYSYDSSGNLAAVIDPRGNSTRFAYDGDGHLISITDALDRGSTFEYDDNGRLTRLIGPAGQSNMLTYTPDGQLASTTDADGLETAYEYDPHGNEIARNRTGAFDEISSYDALGRLVRVADAYDAATHLAYDARDLPVELTDALGGKVSLEYDANGALSAVVNGLGSRRLYEYDQGFNLQSVTDEIGAVTLYSYDAQDRLIGVTDAQGQTTAYERDAAGRLTKVVDALGRETQLDYDANHNLVSVTKPDGSLISYTYDELNRLVGVAYPDGSDAQLTYDAVGNIVGAAYGSHATEYTYDDLDRLVGISFPTESVEILRSLTPAGRLAELQMLSDSDQLLHLGYNRNSAGLLDTLVDHAAQETYSLAYDANGALAALSLPGGLKSEYTRDALGQVTRLAHFSPEKQLESAYEYAYDLTGSPRAITETTTAGTLVETYSFDPRSRLVGVQGPTGQTTFDYDTLGNLLSRTGPSGTVTYTYDAANQLIESTLGSFGYDSSGNLTQKVIATGVYTFEYDAEDRCTNAWLPSGEHLEYAYDAIGRRTNVRSADEQSTIVHYGMHPIAELYGASPDALSLDTYVLARGRLLGRRSEGGTAAYLADALGSVRQLVSSDGSAIDTYRYDAFGEATAAKGEDRNPYRWLGQLGVRSTANDPGVYTMGLRDYDSTLARFTTQDALIGYLDLGEPYDQHPYLYAYDNPVRFTDPTGLRPESSPLPALPGHVGHANDALSRASPGTPSMEPSSRPLVAAPTGPEVARQWTSSASRPGGAAWRNKLPAAVANGTRELDPADLGAQSRRGR